MILSFAVAKNESKEPLVYIYALPSLFLQLVHKPIRIHCFNAVQLVKVIESYYWSEEVFRSDFDWRQRIVHYADVGDFREGSECQVETSYVGPSICLILKFKHEIIGVLLWHWILEFRTNQVSRSFSHSHTHNVVCQFMTALEIEAIESVSIVDSGHVVKDIVILFAHGHASVFPRTIEDIALLIVPVLKIAVFELDAVAAFP